MYESRAAVVSVYYIAASSTMALSLYTVCVSSFATVYGHRLALQGPTGSVDRAVAVMMKQRTGNFVTTSPDPSPGPNPNPSPDPNPYPYPNPNPSPNPNLNPNPNQASSSPSAWPWSSSS